MKILHCIEKEVWEKMEGRSTLERICWKRIQNCQELKINSTQCNC